jgi:hypothetical protein
LLDAHDVGWHIRHGDVDGAEKILREIASASPEDLREKGRRARDLIDSMGGKAAACNRVCDVLERGL